MYSLLKPQVRASGLFTLYNAHRMATLAPYAVRSMRPFHLKGARKAKFFKWKKYPCIPEFMKEVKKDPFEYTLQTKDEVRKQLLVQNNFKLWIGRVMSNETGVNVDTPMHTSLLQKEFARVKFNLHEWPMSSLQKERLIFLLGPRYKDKPEVKMTVKQFPTFIENSQRAKEIVTELVLESLRAPNIDIKAIRNPYYKDRAKKEYGKTKEIRDQRRAEEEEFKAKAYELYEKEGNLLFVSML